MAEVVRELGFHLGIVTEYERDYLIWNTEFQARQVDNEQMQRLFPDLGAHSTHFLFNALDNTTQHFDNRIVFIQVSVIGVEHPPDPEVATNFYFLRLNTSNGFTVAYIILMLQPLPRIAIELKSWMRWVPQMTPSMELELRLKYPKKKPELVPEIEGNSTGSTQQARTAFVVFRNFQQMNYEMAKFIPFDGLKRYCASSYWPNELGMPLLDTEKEMWDKLFHGDVRQLADWYRFWALQFRDSRTQIRQNTFARMRSLPVQTLADMANEFEAFYRALGRQVNDKVNEMQMTGSKALLTRLKLEPSTCDEYLLKCHAGMLASVMNAAESGMAMWRNEEVQRWQEKMFWGFGGALLRDDFPQEFAFCLREFAIVSQHIHMTENLLKVCVKLQSMLHVSGRVHSADDLIATVLSVEPMKFIYRGRIAVFSVRVLRDERVCIVAEQRPEVNEEEAFGWMVRVLQAIDSIHQLGVYCLSLVPPNQLPKTPLGGIHVTECRQRFLDGCLHPSTLLMCPQNCVLNLPKPREPPADVGPAAMFVGNIVQGVRIAALLLEKGRLTAGDHVALIFPPGLDLITAVFGCFCAQLVPVCIRATSAQNLHTSMLTVRMIVDVSKAVALLSNCSLIKLLKSKELSHRVSTKAWPTILDIEDALSLSCKIEHG